MDSKIIYLLKKTILYKWYHQYNLRKINKENDIRRAYFLEEAEQLLNKLTISLNNSNILFWLDYGTLLGYYRENDFIKHDNDLDIGARVEDAEKIRTVLTSNGFKLVHKYHSSNFATADISHFSFEYAWANELPCPRTVKPIDSAIELSRFTDDPAQV